jgi:hypothetical protein
MPSRRDEDKILVTVVWCRRVQDEEEEVQHIQMGRVGVDWEFAWSLQQVLGGGSADGFFPSTLGCFGTGATLVRASGSRLREGGWQQQKFWRAAWLQGLGWHGRKSGALLTHFRRSRGARLHRCNSRRKHRCFGSVVRCCCSCARRSTSFPRCRPAFKQRHGRAGVRRRRGMCLGGDRMRLGPAEPALASPAPTGLRSVQRAAFSHRAHIVAGVSLAALCCAAGPLLAFC